MEQVEERRNPEGAKVIASNRIPPDRPITYRDMVPTHRYSEPYEVRDFTNEEIEALPVSGRFGPPFGWEKTGYLQPIKLFGVSGGNDRLVYYEYVEFVGRGSHRGRDFDDAKFYLVHVKGSPLIDERSEYE